MTRATADYAALVGIDWVDRKHDLCLQAAGSERRERLVLEHRPEAIDEWACTLRVRFGGQPVAICLEQHKGPLMAALAKYDHLVLYPVNPLLVATRRRGLKPSGAKSDTADAELILDLLIEQGAKRRPWHPDDVRTRQLQALVEARRTLVESRVRTTHALTANLKLYFPQALDCFDDIASGLACGFLTQWPSLGQAQRAREATLTTFFHQHGVRGEDLITGRIAALRAAMPLTTDSGILVPALLRTKTLLAVLRAQLDGIGEYDVAITKAFDAHPDATVFASFPGAGPTFAPRLLAAFGSDRQRFASARAIQEYAGVAPVTEASGQSRWVHWRFACPRFIRQSIVEWAGMSMRYSFWATNLLPRVTRTREGPQCGGTRARVQMVADRLSLLTGPQALRRGEVSLELAEAAIAAPASRGETPRPTRLRSAADHPQHVRMLWVTCGQPVDAQWVLSADFLDSRTQGVTLALE